jgi:levanase/fructan beta-fructosidase
MAFMGYNRKILRTWEGQMCFPCELTLHDTPEGVRMHRRPITTIENLHQKTRSWTDESVDNREVTLGEGDALDIRLLVEPHTATSFGLIARGEEVAYSVSEQQVRCLGAVAPLALVDGRVQLQVLVDRASMEVFGNEGQISMSSLFFPDPEDRQLRFFSRGGIAKIVRLDVHWVGSIWQSFHARRHRAGLTSSRRQLRH